MSTLSELHGSYSPESCVDVRPIADADIPALFDLMVESGQSYLNRYGTQFYPSGITGKEDYTRIISMQTAIHQAGQWAIGSDGRVAGYMAHYPDDSVPAVAEMMYWVGRRYAGQRIGTRALSMATQRLHAEGFTVLKLRIASGNAASYRVAEHAGYTPCGITGEYDVLRSVYHEEQG